MKKIIKPKTDKVNELQSWCDYVLECIGAESAFITDESTIGDFWALDQNDKKFEARLKKASLKLGFNIHNEDYIHEVAKKAMLK